MVGGHVVCSCQIKQNQQKNSRCHDWEDEINRLVNYLKNSGFGTSYEDSIFDCPSNSGMGGSSSGDKDDLFDEALSDLVQSTGRASATFLQRRLSIWIL